MTKKEKRFVATVYDFYQQHGRHTLPWRETYDPYHVWISEVMLQQTQVERVIPKYQAFLEIFPDIHTLAGASLSAVLIQWQGLGYNRRAKMLHACANEVVSSFSGKFPDTFNALTQLPGIGPYTAGALLAFAYNTPVPIIETNIRTAYIHHFFSEITEVTDAKILQCIEKTLNKENPREWYWAP